MLRVLHRLRQEDPDSFAGIVVSPDSSIDLLVTASTPATIQAIEEARAVGRDALPVRLVEGMKRSLADLERVHDRMLERHADLRSRGVNITEFGPDVRANKLRVAVKDLTPELAEIVAREFGVEQVYVVEGGEWTY